jgi:hypothetical protein
MRRVSFEEAVRIISCAPADATRDDLIELLRQAKDAKPESMELYAEALRDVRKEFPKKGWR